MILTHHSAEPLELDFARTYDQAEFGNGKPRGLWLSDESDFGWAQWCRGEEFNLGGLEHSTTFELAPGANVLTLTTGDEMRAFTAEYNHPRSFDGIALGAHWVDWPRVAERFDGILITPYQWEARYDLDMMWYAGWDCASGCFWNLSALVVRELTP